MALLPDSAWLGKADQGWLADGGRGEYPGMRFPSSLAGTGAVDPR